MDTSIVELREPNTHVLVSTTDFFFPLVEDPFLMGRIACANVLSDMYAEGVVHVDTMLMVLAACLRMPDQYRELVTWQMIAGFKSLADEAGTRITGGQSILNPWPIIGGVAQAVLPKEEVLMPVNAVAGDALVLTKPLGTQVAVNLFQYLNKPEQWDKVANIVTVEEAKRAYDIAAASMERLNRGAAQLMWSYGAHAATDVTGFGILGHARNLVANQKAQVSFSIGTLPVIRKMAAVDDQLDNCFKLVEGSSAETSGGLLVCLPKEMASTYCRELCEREGWPAIVIGEVVEGPREAHIVRDVSIVEIE